MGKFMNDRAGEQNEGGKRNSDRSASEYEKKQSCHRLSIPIGDAGQKKQFNTEYDDIPKKHIGLSMRRF